MCKSCYVYIDPKVLDKLPPKSDEEEMLTEWIMSPNDNTRFACEIILAPELDGMMVVVPEYYSADL